MSDWERKAKDSFNWRSLVHQGCKNLETDRIRHSKLKRAVHKRNLEKLPENAEKRMEVVAQSPKTRGWYYASDH